MGSALDSVMKDLNKKFKAEFIQRGAPTFGFEKIPFTSPKLNYMLYGGLPIGYIVEFSGRESSGKTTTSLDVVANAQKLFYNMETPREVVFFDVENTFDYAWAQTLGVDTDRLILVSPQDQSAEEILEAALDVIDSGDVGLCVLDSLAAMVSKAAFEESLEKKHYGGISTALTEFSKKATQICKRNKCTFIGINQVRDNMNSMYGGTTTPGGLCWKHSCLVRMSFQKGKFIDEKNNEVANSTTNPFGNIVNVCIEKTKSCAPNRRTGHYTLNYTEGVDYVNDMIDMCMLYGFIIQGGAWFTIIDPETGELLQHNGKDMKFQGRPKVCTYLKENRDFYEQLNGILTKMSEK